MLTVTMNNEIRIATLSERNRIAREIHDNVGHMLSRAILQLGAIMTVYRKDTIYDNLVPIKYSLDTAMNNIRKAYMTFIRMDLMLKKQRNPYFQRLEIMILILYVTYHKMQIKKLNMLL